MVEWLLQQPHCVVYIVYPAKLPLQGVGQVAGVVIVFTLRIKKTFWHLAIVVSARAYRKCGNAGSALFQKSLAMYF
jgi:hypothetical protein